MADQDSAQRPRPFVPPAPPFRGPAAAARPALTPFTPPDAARPPAPVIARRPAKPVEPTRNAAPAPADPHRTPDFIREAVAASAAAATAPASDDAHLYGRDPFASTAGGAPPRPSHALPGDDAAPEEAAQALAGLPYFDDNGGEHAAEEPATEQKRTSGKVHRVGHDPAAILESVALRVRAGGIQVAGLDANASDAAVLAAVLAALLRDGR